MGSWLLTRMSLLDAVHVGRLILGRFDCIAELMGIPSAPFLETYPDDVKNLKLSILNYMKAVRAKKSHADILFGIGNDGRWPNLVLESTPDGFPIIPTPLPSDTWRKKDWEELFTMYMGRHYCRVQFLLRRLDYLQFGQN